MKIKQEYIWLDGSQPQQLRSKTKIVTESLRPDNNVDNYLMWSFDGSSTLQAKAGRGENTDCLLKPVFIVDDPFRGNPHKLVFCEVLNPDGSLHPSNNRRKLKNRIDQLNLTESLDKSDQPWFGWEQEYTVGPTQTWLEHIQQNKIVELDRKDYAPGRGMSWGQYAS